jgi:hypothetical protein
MAVLTSGHATFAADSLPQGNGSIVAIASIYRGTMQLVVRDYYEVNMNGKRCGAGTILQESFESGIGSFMTYNVLGEQTWAWRSQDSTMQMTRGAETNEDWLVSPALDFSEIIEEATFYFKHAIAHIGQGTVSPEYMKTNQTVWLSFDYTSGDPKNATWTQIPLTDNDLPSGTNWEMAQASLVLPSSVFGKNKVHVAFKYTCDENESASWRIDNILIKEKNKNSEP